MNNYLRFIRQKPVLYFRILFFCLLIAYCFLRLTTPAYAHILLTDGSIGAVVHVNPEDDPIIGQPAQFFFEFKDKENKFIPSNCDCQYSLELNGKVLTEGDLFADTSNPSLDNASFSYTFSEKGVYSVIITGEPKTSGSFQSFRLEDSIRVERGDQNQTSTSDNSSSWTSLHYIHFIIFGIGAAIALTIVFFDKRKKL